MKSYLLQGLLGFFFASSAFAQDTLSSEYPASGSYSPPVQVVPAEPGLWQSVPKSNTNGAIVPPNETQTFQDFPAAESQSVGSSQGTSRMQTSDGSLSDGILDTFNINENNSYASTLALRETRKIGVGAAVGGDTGMFGLKFEFNFEDADGATAAVGWGPGYRSFALNWKHTWNQFLDTDFSPYIAAGYSHWFSTGNGQYENSDILKQTLTEKQRSDRNFGLDFISGFAGLQYYVLSGEGAGLSFYAELGLMNQIIPARNTVLTGGVGSTFYF